LTVVELDCGIHGVWSLISVGDRLWGSSMVASMARGAQSQGSSTATSMESGYGRQISAAIAIGKKGERD
jgi:hypothetical protein